MENSQFNPAVEIIKLANGQDAVNLMQVNDRVAAIVDYQVLKSLTDLLQTVDMSEVKSKLIEQIREVYTIPELITVLENEVAFHKTVNVIQATNIFKKSVQEVVPQKHY